MTTAGGPTKVIILTTVRMMIGEIHILKVISDPDVSLRLLHLEVDIR
jgi:hypothetical protein